MDSTKYKRTKPSVIFNVILSFCNENWFLSRDGAHYPEDGGLSLSPEVMSQVCNHLINTGRQVNASSPYFLAQRDRQYLPARKIK